MPFPKLLIHIAFISFCSTFSGAGLSEEVASVPTLSAKEDYITCWKQPCIYAAGSEWSERNPNGVAVAVAMGTEPAVTDDQIKMVLTHDLEANGVEHIKFFFEQNDAPACGIVFHVRGGSEGIFTIGNVREHVRAVARSALNENPLFQ